jgi:CubicO group peptidase (beta-lactamase class C family)
VKLVCGSLAVCSSVAVLAAGCLAPGQEGHANGRGWSPARIDSLRSVMHGLMSEYSVPGVAIALTFQDSIQAAFGFGVTGPGGSSVTPETVFQVASLGKPVFAHLLAKLETERDWTLTDPMAEWSPEAPLPPTWLSLSAETLLSHTSGLRYDPERDRVTLAPGAPGLWSYSGAGYVALQRAIEAAEGRGLVQLALAGLFEPWDLGTMSFVTPAAGPLAFGHDRSGAPLDGLAWSEPNAASSLHSSVLDYARFMIRAATHAPRSWTRLTRRRATVDAELGLYWGAGWALQEDVDGSVVAFHWGSNPGFKCFALIDREREMGLVILTNGDLGLELVERAVAILDDRPHPLFEFYMLHPDD